MGHAKHVTSASWWVQDLTPSVHASSAMCMYPGLATNCWPCTISAAGHWRYICVQRSMGSSFKQGTVTSARKGHPNVDHQPWQSIAAAGLLQPVSTSSLQASACAEVHMAKDWVHDHAFC